MSSQKLAIVVIPANDWAKEQYSITKPSILSYSRKVKADLIEIIDDLYPDYPLDNKYRVQKITQFYDRTLYLDCDIFPTRLAPNIFKYVDSDYAMVDELNHVDTHFVNIYLKQCMEIGQLLGYEPNPPQKIPNGGLMLLPKDANYFKPQNAPEYWCLDQYTLAYTIQPYWLASIWNWGYIREDWIEGLDRAYFIHLNGSSKDRRIKLLKRNVEEYGMR